MAEFASKSAIEMKESGKTCGKSNATTLYTKAAPVPKLISVHIFGLRLTTDCQPRLKNGAPAHSTTGTDSANSTQLCVPMLNKFSLCPTIARVATTTVNGNVHQKRC